VIALDRGKAVGVTGCDEGQEDGDGDELLRIGVNAGAEKRRAVFSTAVIRLTAP